MKKLVLFAMVLSIMPGFQSCREDFDEITSTNLSLKSVPVPSLDWENIDWMPTPSGQSQISVPWIGQGSISSLYSLDVVNDYKSIDGWELVYNTFDPNSSGNLVNPYFILYNKYRGTIRIYLYTTTPFVQNSTYLQDGLSLITSSSSSILNFLGDDLIDVSVNKTGYSQMQPKPLDGSFPLASNKWYMLEYELAYDPSLSSKSSNDILLSWFTNFYGISDVKLFGEINGAITGSIGSKEYDFFSSLGTVGQSAGKVALSALGVDFITKMTIDSQTGTNKLNLPENIFKAMSKGMSSALSSAASKLPGNIFNVFSGILSNSSSAGQSVNLKFNTDINLTGDITNHGSFPSSPTSVYIPGTNIQTSSQGYVPNYNNALGVFNLSSKPKVQVKNVTSFKRTGSPREGFSYQTFYEKQITKLDNSNKLVINNDLLNDASVSLIEEDVIFIREGGIGTVSNFDGTKEEIGNYDEIYTNCSYIKSKGPATYIPAIRMTIEVSPNNGQPSVYIVHTFIAEEEVI